MQSAVPTPQSSRARTSPKSDRLRLALLTLLLGALGWASDGLAHAVASPAGGRVELEGAGWEARRLVAQMLWLKTHAVLHAGVEEREALPGEETSRGGEVHRHGSSGAVSVEGSGPDTHAGESPEEHAAHSGEAEEGHDDHKGHDGHGHQGAYVLVIPPPKEDFRGPLGDLERNVKPYLGRNGTMFSKDGDQTLAFYRLITWLDPHHVQAFVVGSSFLCRAGKYPDLGLKFLHEGEHFNPDSFEIQTELGHFYLVYKHHYASAAEHLELALQLLPRHRKLLEVEEDARADAYRWLALTYQEWGRPEKALRIARDGLRLLEHDGTLEHVIQRKGQRVK